MTQGGYIFSVVVSLLICSAKDSCASEEPFEATAREFRAPLARVVGAITNALANGAYHGKSLHALSSYYVEGAKTYTPIHVTNMWTLDNDALPLTLLPEAKKMAAFDEAFVIKAEAVGPDITRVIVRPTSSGVKENRYELSMHLGRILGGKYHPPLASETTNLFQRIENQLSQIQSGRTNVLLPTPDTTPGFYRDFWLNLSVEEKHDPQNWKKMVEAWKSLHDLQTATNNARAATNATK